MLQLCAHDFCLLQQIYGLVPVRDGDYSTLALAHAQPQVIFLCRPLLFSFQLIRRQVRIKATVLSKQQPQLQLRIYLGSRGLHGLCVRQDNFVPWLTSSLERRFIIIIIIIKIIIIIIIIIVIIIIIIIFIVAVIAHVMIGLGF